MPLRALMVHNRYQIRAGEDESQAAELALLRSDGIEADFYEKDNREIQTLSVMATAAGTAWSRSTYRDIDRMLQSKKYDLVHVQNFFPLISPSVHYAAQKNDVPVVQSLRNYRLLCPAATLFRNGRICEECVGRALPWRAVLHACYRGDRLASAAVTTMLGLHNMLRTWDRKVDLYLALSEFAKAKFVSAGFAADKIRVKPNFVAPDPGIGLGDGGFALFVGRLTPEKGLATLIDAWRRIGSRLPLKIVGEGPLEGWLADQEREIGGIQLLGRRTPSETLDLMGKSMVLVVPSEWYEPFGRVVVEAFSRGTPVIAARVGGIAELIQDGRTGFLFESCDSSGLADKAMQVLIDPPGHAAMRMAARQSYLRSYTASANIAALREAYETAIDLHARTGRHGDA